MNLVKILLLLDIIETFKIILTKMFVIFLKFFYLFCNFFINIIQTGALENQRAILYFLISSTKKMKIINYHHGKIRKGLQLIWLNIQFKIVAFLLLLLLFSPLFFSLQ